MADPINVVATEVAVVHRFRKRRYLTKRAAYAAMAKAALQTGHERISSEEYGEGGASCYCAWCTNQRASGNAYAVLTKRLMRGEVTYEQAVQEIEDDE